jgi:hypothetical protein
MACRFCHYTPGLTESTPLCYAVSLFFKDANGLLDALKNIERTNIVIPGIITRCELCQSNSVISYCMYVYMHTEHAQIHAERCVDATEYYNRILYKYALLYPPSSINVHSNDVDALLYPPSSINVHSNDVDALLYPPSSINVHSNDVDVEMAHVNSDVDDDSDNDIGSSSSILSYDKV